VCTALLRAGVWGEAECHKIYTINILPTMSDPNKKGSFCSRKNLLENSRRPADLEKLMAFGLQPLATSGKAGKNLHNEDFVILGYAPW
jgi:hypothetical protein